MERRGDEAADQNGEAAGKYDHYEASEFQAVEFGVQDNRQEVMCGGDHCHREKTQQNQV